VKKFCFLMILPSLVLAEDFREKPDDHSFSQVISVAQLSEDLIYAEVTVLLRQKEIVSGRLIGLENRTIILATVGGKKKISAEEISKIIFRRERDLLRDDLWGALLGAYIGVLAGSRLWDDSRPFGYFDEDDPFTPFLFAEAGFGLAVLLDKMKCAFNFSDEEGERRREWNRLERFIRGETYPPRIQISARGGYVFSGLSDHYKANLEGVGLYPLYREEKLNFLRAVQVSYSFKPRFGFGLAYYSLSEPRMDTYWNYYPEVMNPYQPWKESFFEYHQAQNSRGLYAVALYQPFRSSRPRRLNWTIGIGAGGVKADFHIQTYYAIYMESLIGSEIEYEESQEYRINKTSPSAVFMTELSYRLNPKFSLGIYVDYVFVPAFDFQAIQVRTYQDLSIHTIPAQKVSVGNGCIGISIGLHF